MITVYGLKNCDTCRKAIKALTSGNVDHHYVDVRSDGITAKTIMGWLKTVDAKILVNTRSTTWRGLDEQMRTRAHGDPKDIAALLVEYPTLIKRPVIEVGKNVYIGWTKDTQHTVLKS